jgi:hypothetical protein
MKEFVLLFRHSFDGRNPSPEEMQVETKKWKDWISGIVAQDKLVSGGSRLTLEGKVLKGSGIITDGPFVEIKEKLGGFIVVKAEDLEEATTLAHGCPVLEQKGSVEVRPIMN